MEYERSDLGKNIRFIGPLLPYSDKEKQREKWHDDRLNEYKKVMLVTQGTVEKDGSKLLVPVMDAYKNTDMLVVVTTGGSQTSELQAKYPYNNIIISDFIAFDDIMPYTDVFISNGGFGGVMQGVQHGLPMVVAGVHEGKNEICARIGYLKYGINLNTETPTAGQIKSAVAQIEKDGLYRSNIARLKKEFALYDVNKLFAGYVQQSLS